MWPALAAAPGACELQRAELSPGDQPGLAASSFTAKAMTAALVDLHDWARREPDLAVLADVRDWLRAAYHQMANRFRRRPPPSWSTPAQPTSPRPLRPASPPAGPVGRPP